MMNFGEKTENLVDSTEKTPKSVIFQIFNYFHFFAPDMSEIAKTWICFPVFQKL